MSWYKLTLIEWMIHENVEVKEKKPDKIEK